MLASHRQTIAWIVLIAASAAGFGVAGRSPAAGLGFAAVMLMAAFKAAIVTGEYMEIRHAPQVWRLAFVGLVGTATLVIAGLHLIGTRP